MKKFILGFVVMCAACVGAGNKEASNTANDSTIVRNDSVIVTDGDSTTVTTLGVDQTVIDSLDQLELGVE